MFDIDDCTDMIKTLDIDEQTFKRLSSIREEIMHIKKKDVTYDETINDLIDSYLDNTWGHIGIGAGAGGG